MVEGMEAAGLDSLINREWIESKDGRRTVDGMFEEKFHHSGNIKLNPHESHLGRPLYSKESPARHSRSRRVFLFILISKGESTRIGKGWKW